MEPTTSLSEYSAESLERVQTSFAHCIARKLAGGADASELTELVGMYQDIENETARRSAELAQFIAERG